MPTGNDDFGSADEVRIYKDEGEDDVQRASENLSEDKIGLVTETEKRADACGSSHTGMTVGGVGLDSGVMSAWASGASANANAAASFYSSLFNPSYNGLLQQYHLQQLMNNLMSAQPASSSNVLPMQPTLDAKRTREREREREEPVSSPPALSPLTVPGCSSPMLSVLAAMTTALSPVSSAPLHPQSPRCVTPNQPNANASAFRPLPAGPPLGVSPAALGSTWPFGVSMGSPLAAVSASNLMPPPASPFGFASACASQQNPGTPNQALVAAMLSKMQQQAAAANLLAAPSVQRPPPPASNGCSSTSSASAARAHQHGEQERRAQSTREHERAHASRRDADRERQPNSAATAHSRVPHDIAARVTSPSNSPLARPAADTHSSRPTAGDDSAPRKNGEATGESQSNSKPNTEDVKPSVTTHNGHLPPSANGSASRKRPLDSSRGSAAGPSVSAWRTAAGDVSEAGSKTGDSTRQAKQEAAGDHGDGHGHVHVHGEAIVDDDNDDGESDSDVDDSDGSSMGDHLNASGDGDGEALSSTRQAETGVGGGSGSTSSSAAARRWTNVKKPLNAFMLFMKEQRAAVMGESTLKESAAINQLLGRKWHALERREQEKYYELARRVKEEHARLYPGWSARDNYALHSRRKKRRLLTNFVPATADRHGAASGSLDLPGASARDCASPKKCRARFGLENQKDWCKPCRRKKKCIRFAAEVERSLGACGSAGAKHARGAGGDPRTHELFAAGMLKSPFPFGAEFPVQQPNSGQFPFGFPIEAYLQMTGGAAGYRFPFGASAPSGPGALMATVYSQPLTAERLAAAALGVTRASAPLGAPPLLASRGHSNHALLQPSDATSTCCTSPNCGERDATADRLRRCSSTGSSRAMTLRHSETECNNLVSESDDDETPAVRQPRGGVHSEDVDADGEEKPITRAAAEDPPFAYDDGPNLSPLSVDEDDTAMLRGGTLVSSSPRAGVTVSASDFDSCTTGRSISATGTGTGVPNGNGSVVSTANGSLQLQIATSATLASCSVSTAETSSTKRRDADSQNNNAARSARSVPATESSSQLVDTTQTQTQIASESNGTNARQADVVSVADDRRQLAGDRLRLIGAVECNAVS